jgi:hypothetical protein
MLMDRDETPQDRAQRQVIEAEAQVAAQVARIAELKRLHHDTKADEVVLTVLKEGLKRFYKELARQRDSDGR